MINKEDDGSYTWKGLSLEDLKRISELVIDAEQDAHDLFNMFTEEDEVAFSKLYWQLATINLDNKEQL